jgi:hypothetical protein
MILPFKREKPCWWQIRMLEGGCNNLNQLAKMAHQQGFSLLKGKIMDLLDEFNKIIERI